MTSRARRTRSRVVTDLLRLTADRSSPLHEATVENITWSVAGSNSAWVDFETAWGVQVEIHVTVTDPGDGSDGER